MVGSGEGSGVGTLEGSGVGRVVAEDAARAPDQSELIRGAVLKSESERSRQRGQLRKG